MTTYQKLKKENAILKEQLITLCGEPNSYEASLIKMTWKLQYDAEKILFQGCVQSSKLNGIINKIDKQSTKASTKDA